MTISDERRIELLRMVAEHFKDGSDPFGVGILRDHKVTVEECAQLNMDVGVACDTDADILELNLSKKGRFVVKVNEIDDIYQL